jgi:DNA-binding beta-propeller fold protein YncE
MSTKKRSLVRTLLPFVVVVLLGGIFSGCAAKKVGPTGPVFFPPPPDDPHVQYLGGITDSTDIEGKQSSFSLVLTGNEQAQMIKKIGKGYGVAFAKGKLYVCASASGQVIVIDFAQKKFEYLVGNTGKGLLKKPVNIAIDQAGYLYVADTARNEVVVYDPFGNYVKAFGKAEGKSRIVAVAAYGQNLYALDNGTNEIRVFDTKTGEQVKSIGGGRESATSVTVPTGIAIDAEGFIYVTNVGSGRIMKFDRDGNLLKTFGKFGDSFGEFARPRGVAVDDAGRIYVVDAGHQNVQLFDNEARLLTFFGNPDPKLEAGTLNLPSGIAVTKDNLQIFQQKAAPGFILENVIFVLNQYGRPSISMYGLGSMEGKKEGTEKVKGSSEKK